MSNSKATDNAPTGLQGFDRAEGAREFIRLVSAVGMDGLVRALKLVEKHFPKADFDITHNGKTDFSLAIGKKTQTEKRARRMVKAILRIIPWRNGAVIRIPRRTRLAEILKAETGKSEDFFTREFSLEEIARNDKQFDTFLNVLSKSSTIVKRAAGNARRPDDYDDSASEKQPDKITWTLREQADDRHLLDEIQELCGDDSGEPTTTRQQLLLARIGQRKFRDSVLERWRGGCAVTGAKTLEALRASHIRPWSECDGKDRLNPQNGLPLIATLDALFDRWLISFKDDGSMLVSKRILAKERKLLGIPSPLLREPDKYEQEFLNIHRDNFKKYNV